MAMISPSAWTVVMREVSIKQFSSTIDEDVPRSITMSFSTFSFGSVRRHPANRSRASTVVASSDSFRMMRYSIRDRSVRGTSPATICVKQEKKHDSTERLLELRRRKGRQEPQRTHVETQHRRHRLRKQRRREEKRPVATQRDDEVDQRIDFIALLRERGERKLRKATM